MTKSQIAEMLYQKLINTGHVSGGTLSNLRNGRLTLSISRIEKLMRLLDIKKITINLAVDDSENDGQEKK